MNIDRAFNGNSFSADDLELLELMLQQEGIACDESQGIPRRDEQAPIPLSFAQERLWVLDQIEPDSHAYTIPVALRLRGQLHSAALQQSLTTIVARHEALRTVFELQSNVSEDQPVQVIVPAAEVSLPIIDLQALASAERDAEVRRRASEEARRPFDLGRGPLFRATLLQLSAENFVLLLSVHHIVFDGWSIMVFIRELAALYTALAADRSDAPSPQSPPLPIQYADFASWQRQPQQVAALERELDYWRRQLADIPTALNLPTDRPRPAVYSSRGATLSFMIEVQLAAELRALSSREGATLFTLLLAAFQVLLQRYTDQDDIVVGSPIANRDRAELEPLIGLLINTLVLRADLSGNPTFREALARVRATVNDAFSNQNVPFEHLVAELQPVRDMSRNPLFQVLFVMQTTTLDTLTLPGLAIQRMQLNSGTAKFDLTLGLEEAEQSIAGVIEYNTDLFDAETITRLAEHFQTLLGGIVADPDRRLAALPLVTDAEHRQQLVAWNTTTAPFPHDRCVHELIEAQAARTPEAIAVVFGQDTLSYRELNARANQLAHHLQSCGVRAESRVGICVERSLELMIGLLGILKAGAAYVPLDPAYPQERLQYMAQDAQLTVVLTQAHLRERVPDVSAHIMCLDGDWSTISSQPTDNPTSAVTPDNTVYLIYTSGSTGQPKGAAVHQRGLVNLVSWYVDRFAMTADDRVLIITSLSFDLTQKNLFAPLIVGGRLALIPSEQFDPTPILETIQQEQITILNCTPSAAYPLVEQSVPEFAALRSVRYLFLGGEPIAVGRLSPWLESPSCQVTIVNTYGPTECSDVTTFHQLDSRRHDAAVPIGRPVQNTTQYILDQHLNLLPVGASGELCIGGVGVGLGYVNDARLTAAKFLPDPFSAAPGARLYRTGDLARFQPDGTIDFLGRIDHQVKLRGFRIELGEIEAVLAQHPAVEQAIVVVREDASAGALGAKRLIAYVVEEQRTTEQSTGDSPGSGQEGVEQSETEVRASGEGLTSSLRQFLQARLPEHMLPAAIVVLDEVPLTPSGKLDRNALPTPEQDRSTLTSDFVAPRTTIEQDIAKIWQQSLGQEQIGVYDRFFELGGDSILAVQVVSRAARAGIHFTPKQLFQYPTIAELAGVATTSTSVVAEQGIVSGPVPLTPIQQWFFAQQRPDPQHFNQALLLNAHQSLKPELLDRALQQLVRHHDALRLRFEHTPDGWQQHYAAPDERSLLLAVDLSESTAAEASARRETIAAELHGSLDLAAGPLLRAALFEHGPEQPQQVLLIVHHLVVDGLSWRVLVEDLQTAYEQLLQQPHPESLRLPAKTNSFKQWAEQLRDYAQTADLQAEADYWRDLAQQPMPALPVDHPTGSAGIDSAQTVSAALSAEATQALLQTAPAAYNTQVNDLLLAALVQTFAVWTGSSQLHIDLEGHGREPLFEDVDLSRTVGWFTTLVPLRLELTDDEPGSTIKTIKEQLRQVPQRGIGFGILRYLSPDAALREQLATLPAAPISFNYLGQTDQQVGGLFSLAPAATGTLQSPRGTRSHLLDINGIIVDGKLRVDLTYSAEIHERATIEQLATAYVAALQRLIDHCAAPGTGGYTPSDFPLVQLDQTTLDRLISGERQIEDLFTLTPVQQGMLFHTLYDPQAGAYLNQLSAQLAGQLDLAAFQRAWQSAVQRHLALRSSLKWEGLDQPVQIVHKTVDLPWTIEDWRELPSEEQQVRLERYLADDRGRGFDLTAAPLLRFALFHAADERYHFVWSYHHLLLDGWSLPIILQDVLADYVTTHDQPSPRPQPRPYRDYLAWLRRQDLTAAEAFWQQMLADVSAATPLGVDQPARRESHPGYGLRQTQLDVPTTERLQSMARQRGLTLSTLIQGAWALLLGVYSGENDVFFGVTVAGRPPELPGSETMVGLLINTLPLRVRLAPHRPLGDWLAELQARQVDLRQYEYTPLPQIQAWSAVPRGQPLFESIVVFENYPVADTVREGPAATLSIDAVQSHEQTNYPLTILAASGQQLELRLSYDRSRFATATIERMLTHLTTLLSRIVGQPEQPLAALSPLTDDERRQIAEQWNHTNTAYPQLACLHQLFEAQVERTPEAIALVFEDRQLSYHELNVRANQLAHHLAALGVGPDVAVGICTERSLDLVIGLLGILKAGGAYVPFDPGYPAERLHYMLHDAKAPVLLAQSQLVERLQLEGSAQQPRVVLLDEDQELLAREPETNRQHTVDLDNLAYIIYTSGSTGQPKGAMNSHRAIGNRLLWMQDMYGLTAEDRVLQKTPFSFDVSVWEFFWPLLTGAALVVAKPGGHQDPAYLAELMQRERITTTHFVPSMLRIFLEEPGIAQIQHLRRVICSGEALPVETETLFFERMRAELYNLYGPTEAAVDVSYWPCRQERHTESVPIGYPVANTQLYILSRSMEPVPVGVAGELYIGGVQLARGYLGRPSLTAETFVPDPFSHQPGARLYRTGDQARHLPDGAIDYLGRLDQQVKVRGFRIELGEIEAALRQHEQIAEAVATVREDVPGDRRIVAYVVENKELGAMPRGRPAHKEQENDPSVPATCSLFSVLCSPQELRAFLAKRLPEYMIPSAFVILDTLPLSPNGKLDRRALPEPEQTRPDLEEIFVAPRTSHEQELAAIWQTVLRVDRVGIHDNFFALGGDSILSLQVTAQAAALGMHISPRHIFEHPTIADLVRALDSTTPVPAEQGIVSGPVALTPIQEWFFEQPLHEPHYWNQALLLAAGQPLDPNLLAQTIEQLVAHHDALRLRFERTPDGWQQHNAAPVEQPIVTYIELATMSEAQQIAAIAEEGNRLHASLDLAAGPLLRVALFDCGAARPQRLLIVVHHLAIDGVAWRILLEDLQSVYQQLSRRQPVALPPKTTSFQHWAARLDEYARSTALQAELHYWLDPARSTAQPLPIDHRDGTNAVSANRTAAVTLTPQETTALLQQVPRVYRTQINDLLLTALYQAWCEWTGSHTLLVDLEGHGRNLHLDALDLSRTVGWFTAIFPVLLSLETPREIESTIKAIKEQLRAIPNHGIGYGLLRYLSDQPEIQQQLAALPAAQISFNYLGQLDHTLSEGTLLHLVREPSGAARSPRDARRYELDITAYVVGGELHVEWTYSAARFDDATIERVAQQYQTALRELIQHCLARTTSAATPSDFPLTNMNQQQIDGVLATLRKRKQGRAQ